MCNLRLLDNLKILMLLLEDIEFPIIKKAGETNKIDIIQAYITDSIYY